MPTAPARPWLGSSSIAGWANLSPFSTPLQEYQKAIGEAPELLAKDEEFFRRRKALEPYVTAVVEDRYGMKMVAQNIRYADPELDFLRAEIDFEAIDVDGTEVNGEIKTVHPFAAKDWGQDGEESYPIYVAAQVQQGLAIRPKRRAVLIACVGFDDFRRYDVLPDPDVAAQLRVIARDSWQNHVLARVPPQPISAEDVRLRYALSKSQPIEATTALAALVEQHAAQKLAEKSAKEAIADLALELQMFMGEHDTLTFQGKVLATWKTSAAGKQLDAEALQRAHPTIYAQFLREKKAARPFLNKVKG